MHIAHIIAAKELSVNESRSFFSKESIYCQVMLWKGEWNMAHNEQPERDVDDLIFEDEPWFPSER